MENIKKPQTRALERIQRVIEYVMLMEESRSREEVDISIDDLGNKTTEKIYEFNYDRAEQICKYKSFDETFNDEIASNNKSTDIFSRSSPVSPIFPTVPNDNSNSSVKEIEKDTKNGTFVVSGSKSFAKKPPLRKILSNSFKTLNVDYNSRYFTRSFAEKACLIQQSNVVTINIKPEDKLPTQPMPIASNKDIRIIRRKRRVSLFDN